MATEQTKRPHLYALDPLRACTALGVVMVHVLAYTLYLNSTSMAYNIQDAIMVAFHFTREVFIFVTAFALIYVYNGRNISLWQFWKKRAVGVLLPYVCWSLIYLYVGTPFSSPGAFLHTIIFDLLTGNASYQLYYILLTIQFYLIFPLFLPFIRLCAQRPWITLSISFAIQMVFFYIDFHTIQSSNTPFWQTVTNYQNRFLPVYQFYFIVGGLTAVYFKQVQAFLLRHGWLVVSAFIVALTGLWLHFALQIDVFHENIGYMSSVLQPVMVPYSVAVIFFTFWLAIRWAKKKNVQQILRGVRFWHTLSDASFGIYLIHALILNAILLRWMVPALPTVWPVATRVLLTWLVTAGSTAMISILLMNIPAISRLVGRQTTFRALQARASKPEATRSVLVEKENYMHPKQHAPSS